MNNLSGWQHPAKCLARSAIDPPPTASPSYDVTFLCDSFLSADCGAGQLCDYWGDTMGVKIFVSLDTPDSKVSNTLGKQDNKLSYD